MEQSLIDDFERLVSGDNKPEHTTWYFKKIVVSVIKSSTMIIPVIRIRELFGREGFSLSNVRDALELLSQVRYLFIDSDNKSLDELHSNYVLTELEVLLKKYLRVQIKETLFQDLSLT